MTNSVRFVIAALVVCGPFAASHSQQADPAPLRAPATPLIVHDPYFSLWSNTDQLTGGATRHWTGVLQPINGIVRIDGKNYRYLGDADDAIPALEETQREITPTLTVVTLANPKIELRLGFFTPALPDDMRVMARPVTYLTWTVKSRDGNPHRVSLYLDISGDFATNTSDEPVVWSRAHIPGLELLRVGSQKQSVLEQWGDDLRINWGYFYIAIPNNQGPVSICAGNETDRDRFVSTGTLPDQDDIDQPRVPQSRYPPAPLLATVLPLGQVGASPVTRHVLLSYNDIYSLEYMHQKLLPYWRTEFPTFAAMLEGAERDYPSLQKRAAVYDSQLEQDLVKVGGREYAAIAVLAFRQAIGAHKLVEAADGTAFFMPKENFSNGSISTVDVLYPSAPMFLFLNPKLIEAQLEPVLRYAETSRWKFPFAPHDLGVYPLANGQLYGGGEISEDDQMPVEESGNMILMLTALAHAEHNPAFAGRYWPLVTKWAEYLLAKGFDPENQLCTDDFAGHLAHNANLSIKAIEALAAYAQLAQGLGHQGMAEKYDSAARSMAQKWAVMAADGDHSRLAFDKSNTWSQKYNLVWDRILDFHVFAPEIAEQEVAFYKSHLHRFGLPLDNRATYTKLDWTIWSATLASNAADFQTIVHPVFQFLNQTPDRVPMTDWYDTISARQVGFQARSVVGGVYIKMLADSQMWSKWAGRAAQNSVNQ
jgi:Domain of unknown function (DUF4965)/Domain of unknown function (DUF5127)/Domain of unknown function (DUF1793)/Domain of unknown function (DUF4964)